VSWKFWRRKGALTTESDTESEVDGTDEGQLRLPAPSTMPPAASDDALRMQGFSFEGPFLDPNGDAFDSAVFPEARFDGTGFDSSDPADESPLSGALLKGDTDVVRSMPSGPLPERAEMERVVRRKAAGRRGVDVRSLGVEPVWVPSLQEQAVGYRLAAAREQEPAVARDFYAAYLELCPDDAVAWFNQGQLLLVDRRLEQAWQAFNAAFKADPTDGLAAGALGYLSGVRGDYVGAVDRYTEAVVLRTGCPDMLSGLADAQLAAGRTADAARTRAEIERLDSQR
jgi:hypothetical protein